MRVFHFCQSDFSGGAARASFAIHAALLDAGVESYLIVNERSSGQRNVLRSDSVWCNFTAFIVPRVVRRFTRLLLGGLAEDFSVGLFSSGSGLGKFEFRSDDIIHLHWVNLEMLGISKIKSFPGNIVWTLHDLWPLLGGSHYPRVISGDTRGFRVLVYKCIDKWLFRKKSWLRESKSISWVAPSSWVKRWVSDHRSISPSNLSLIPLPVSSSTWKRTCCFDLLPVCLLRKSRDPLKRLILFCAPGGTRDERKGFGDLLDALSLFKGRDLSSICLIILAGDESTIHKNVPCSWLRLPPINNDKAMVQLYSICDVLAMPSKFETFGLVACEAMFVGLPVVSYRNTGVSDLVVHRKNGYLAQSSNIKDFSVGIEWCLKAAGTIDQAWRYEKSKEFSASNVAAMYIDLYETLHMRGCGK